jgi:nicotinate phosphoribosyltransferase
VDTAMPEPFPSLLLTDLYELTMLQAYFDCGTNNTATFEFFVRRLLRQRNFLLTAGLAQVLDYLDGLQFSTDDIFLLASKGRFTGHDVAFDSQLHAAIARQTRLALGH